MVYMVPWAQRMLSWVEEFLGMRNGSRSNLWEVTLRLAVIAIMSLAFASVAAQAQQASSIDKIDIIQSGIFQTQLTKIEKNGDVTTQSIRNAKPTKLVKSTATIPGQLNTSFGFTFKVSGTPPGADVTLDCITRFPPEGIKHPQTGQIHHEDHFKYTLPVGKVGYRGYFIGHPWEIVPGAWTLELWYEGRKLAEQQFTMLAP
jgi:hypothetical protein